MSKMKKRIPVFLLAIAMMVAMALPTFAAGVTTSVLPDMILILWSHAGKGNLTVSTFGTAGSNDPVLVWSEIIGPNQSNVASQEWVEKTYNGKVVIQPISNMKLSLNVYRSGVWPCTVFSLKDNSYEDYALDINRTSGNICTIKLAYRDGYALTATDTAATKFSSGSGYTTRWKSYTGSDSQSWHYTSPN